jgi:hypothetical protein
MKIRPASPEPEWSQCHYCGRHSSARVRDCCPFGRATDSKRLETSVTVNWEAEAEHWLPERDGRGYPGSWVDNPGELLALYASRVLVLLDELARLRGCRDGMGRLAQELGEARRQQANERSRVVEALRLLGAGGAELAIAPEGDVRAVLADDSWYWVGTTRHCARCRSGNCERQTGSVQHPCEPGDGQEEEG